MLQTLYQDKSNSIEQICETLHISRVTLYRYLNTKPAPPTT
jgi:predicted transcriptional regulator YheO